jgi:transglutaminase-like putative cysteine protease
MLMTLTMGAQTKAHAETPPKEYTAASQAWTSNDPKVVQARHWIKEGKFKEAEKLLSEPDPSASADAKEARLETLEVIKRIRWDYHYTAQDIVDSMKDQVPNITLDQVEQWRKAGEVQYRMIDGQIAYFRREPANMYRFCGQAKSMRGSQSDQPEQSSDDSGWTLKKHLQHVIDAAENSDSPYVLPVHHTLKFTLSIPADAEGMKPGALVRVWLPYPQEYGHRQYGVKLVSSSPDNPVIAPPGTPQRTLYFEHRIGKEVKPLVFQEVVEFNSAAYYPKLDPALAEPLPKDYHEGNLGERLPHIKFTPELKNQVAEIVGSETNPLIKANKIYQWIRNNVSYYAEEEYCTIPSFSASCFTRRKGDCGVQSTLFVTMARAAGIPARWQSGWETKPVGWDFHDWSEFYVAPWGWIPVDMSYGRTVVDNDQKISDFYIGHQDSYRMIVNTDWGAPLVPPKHSMRSEPADFQRGEVEIDGKNLYFDQWDFDAEWNWEKQR